MLIRGCLGFVAGVLERGVEGVAGKSWYGRVRDGVPTGVGSEMSITPSSELELTGAISGLLPGRLGPGDVAELWVGAGVRRIGLRAVLGSLLG